MAYYNGTTGDYTIKAGDNLSTIARNAGVSVKDLAGWNNISDVNKIRSGAKLYTKGPTTSTSSNSFKSYMAGTNTVAADDATFLTTVGGKTSINEKNINKNPNVKASTVPVATDAMKASGIQYDWEKEGKIQGFLETNMQTEEAKRQALDARSDISVSGANAANVKDKIQSNQNKNKMGISGDAGTDMDRSVTIAQHARALDLYSTDEMIKYQYDTGVRIAELYGDLKTREVTLTEYQRAIDTAYSEASITGVYFDPIQMQLLNQQSMAKSMKSNPYATAEERARASKVYSGIGNAFLELGLSSKGVDTLEKIYQTQSLALQESANKIAAAGNAIAAKANTATYTQTVSDILKGYEDYKDDEFLKVRIKGTTLSLSDARSLTKIKSVGKKTSTGKI